MVAMFWVGGADGVGGVGAGAGSAGGKGGDGDAVEAHGNDEHVLVVLL